MVPYILALLVIFVILAAVGLGSFLIIRFVYKLYLKVLLFVLLAFLLFIALIYYSVWVEPYTLVVTRANIDLQGLNESIKVVFIADTHLDTTSDEIVHSAIIAANAQDPDYIFLGGDYIEAGKIGKLQILRNLSAKKGTYAVLGNHDYDIMYGGNCSTEDGLFLADSVSSELEAMGITVLRNGAIELSDSLVLVGLDDYWACKDDYSLSKDGTDDYPAKILLTHNQEAIPSEEFTKWDLVLAGHTHCGQIRPPIIGSIPKLLGFKGEYDGGHYRLGNSTHVYTTCGVGGFPMRFFAPPEVTVIEIS